MEPDFKTDYQRRLLVWTRNLSGQPVLWTAKIYFSGIIVKGGPMKLGANLLLREPEHKDFVVSFPKLYVDLGCIGEFKIKAVYGAKSSVQLKI